MKIKKNLSDTDMLAGYMEKDNFAADILRDKPIVKKPAKPETSPIISLPADIIEKLDKEILRMRIECKNKGINEIKWQLASKNDEIILKAVPIKN